MPTWISEMPLWIPIGLGVVGLVLLWTGFSRLEKRVKIAGLVVIGLAVVLGLLSWLLESDREVCARQTRELLIAIDKREWITMQRLLDADFAIVDWHGRDEIIEAAKGYSETFDLRNLKSTGLTAAHPNPSVIVNLRIWAELQKQPVGFSDWRLEWEKSGEKWLLKTATPINEIPGLTSILRKKMLPF